MAPYTEPVRVLTLATAILVTATQGFAATGRISLSGFVIGPMPGTTVANEGYLEFDPSSFDGGRLNFTLPKDYKKNTTVTIKLRMSSQVGACNVVLLAGVVYRQRSGVVLNEDVGAASGFTIDGSNVVALPAALVGFTKTFKLKPKASGPFSTHKSGDAFSVLVARQGADMLDDCPDLIRLHSADIIYTKR